MVGAVARGGQLVRQAGGTVRSMTEAEVKQLMAKQQLKVTNAFCSLNMYIRTLIPAPCPLLTSSPCRWGQEA